MKVLIINVPIRLSDIPRIFPAGPAYIASILRESGHEVRVLDINAIRYTQKQVIDIIRNEHSDVNVIGISGLVTTYSYQLWLVNTLKELFPQITVICGGGLATSIPELLFKKSKVDIAVIGEGERTIIELLDKLAQNTSLANVKGIWYRQDHLVKQTPERELITNLDELPMPAYDLFPVDVYLRNPKLNGFELFSGQKSMNLVTSRGCPFKCNYCYHLFGHGKFRFRSPEKVVEEIRFLKEKYDVGYVWFGDDNTTANKKRLKRLCELLKEEKMPWICSSRVDAIDLDTAKMMKEANCVFIGIGFESGSNEILQNMNKTARVEMAVEMWGNLKAAGIRANPTFMIGYPGETLTTIDETIQLGLDIGFEVIPFYTTPYPGTPLWDYALEKGLFKDEEEYIKSLGDAGVMTINFTELTDEELIWQRERVHRITRSYVSITSIFCSQQAGIYELLELAGLSGVFILEKTKQFKQSEQVDAIFSQVCDQLLNSKEVQLEYKLHLLKLVIAKYLIDSQVDKVKTFIAVYLSLNQSDLSVQQLEQTIKAEVLPNDKKDNFLTETMIENANFLGAIFSQRKSYLDARQILIFAYKLNDKNFDTLYNLAYINLELGLYKEALNYLNQYISLDNTNKEVFLLTAACVEKLGDEETAGRFRDLARVL